MKKIYIIISVIMNELRRVSYILLLEKLQKIFPSKLTLQLKWEHFCNLWNFNLIEYRSKEGFRFSWEFESKLRLNKTFTIVIKFIISLNCYELYINCSNLFFRQVVLSLLFCITWLDQQKLDTVVHPLSPLRKVFINKFRY